MKKLIIAIIIFVAILNLFATAARAEETSAAEEEYEPSDSTYTDIRSYVEDEIVPYIILAVSAVGTIYLAVFPVISGVRKAYRMFKSATSDIASTSEIGKESVVKIDTFRTEIANTISLLKQKTDDGSKELSERIMKLEKMLQEQSRIMEMAFCNTDELVKKGISKEIAKVGANDENKTDSAADM